MLIVLLVAVITTLHYLTSTLHAPYHDIYRRLYYLPIVLGGLWFGLRGGLLTAGAISLLYLPHVLIQWMPSHGNLLEQGLEMVLYHVVGGLTGVLAERERRQKQLYCDAAQRLERSYGQLRQQADALLQADEQLRLRERLSTLGEMSASLAHEIRNPLGSIRMAAEVLLEGVPPEDRRAEFGQILLKESQRLNGVLENFLAMARPATDDRERVELKVLLAKLCRQLQPLAESSGVTLSVGGDDLVLWTAPQPLQQALLNLALNALQAMPAGGGLHFGLQAGTDSHRLEVSDTGPGMAPEVAAQIFDPFFTTRDDGSGLGLTITQRLVERLGGRLQVQSTPGQGTVFTLELPANSSEEADHGR